MGNWLSVKRLTGQEESGLFGNPVLAHPNGFAQLQRDCIRASDRLVQEALSEPAAANGKPGSGRTRIVARIFDDLSDELCRVADLAEFVRLSHPDPEFRAAAEEACIAVSNQVERLNTHKGLYDALNRVSGFDEMTEDAFPQSDVDRRLSKKEDAFPQSDVDRHVSKLFLLDFQQCGIHLDEVSREKVVRLNDEILQLGQAFAANAFTPTLAPSTAIPAHLKPIFPIQSDGQAVISHAYSDNPSERIREAGYRLYHAPHPEKEAVLRRMLDRRWELAQICGYQTFAHRAVLESLAQDPETVTSFLKRLTADLKPRMTEDCNLMLDMKRKSPFGSGGAETELEIWDLAHFSNQARQKWCDVDVLSVANYFSLGACMEGLDMLYRTLFNVYLEVDSAAEGELWHQNVYKLQVKDVSDDRPLGTIYCDFFTRKDKPHQDCHFTIRGGRLTQEGRYQNPVVVVMLNMSPPGLSKPTLLSPFMIDNLFHEMGHAMHSMLARTEYQHVTGTRCSTDFAEVPSTLMEYFASDPRVLHAISRHYRSGEKIPLETLEKVCASKKILSSTDLHQQTMYALLDQVYHAQKLPKGITTTDVLREIHRENHVLKFPPREGASWQLRFSHLVGYGARYYSYLMARAVASKIWQQYFERDPFNAENGGKYRRECLSHGGGKPSRALVSDFLGTPVDAQLLADSLIAETDAKNKLVHDLFLGNNFKSGGGGRRR